MPQSSIAGPLTTIPANEASWDDITAIFGTGDYPGRCQCQRYKAAGRIGRATTPEQRSAMLREQTACGLPGARATSGLVGYLGDDPAGWVAVEPRTAYPKLATSRVVWRGRHEDKDDDGVWAVTCFVVRKGYRRRGLTYPLARGAVDFARDRGACALEGYPIVAPPGTEIPWGDAHVGTRQIFEEAGFTQVSHPTPRCVVMRLDFDRSARS